MPIKLTYPIVLAYAKFAKDSVVIRDFITDVEYKYHGILNEPLIDMYTKFARDVLKDKGYTDQDIKDKDFRIVLKMPYTNKKNDLIEVIILKEWQYNGVSHD